MIQKIETTKAAIPAAPYSQAIVANGFVFTAGVIHLTKEGTLLKGSIDEQIHQIMKNLQVILEAAHASFKDVVKTTIYMTDMSFYKTVNEIYAQYVVDPYPSREAVCIKELPLGAKVEISMIAALPL